MQMHLWAPFCPFRGFAPWVQTLCTCWFIIVTQCAKLHAKVYLVGWEPEGCYCHWLCTALLVLNGTSLNSYNAVLVLNGTSLNSYTALLVLNGTSLNSYKVLLVLNGTSLNSYKALLVLNGRYLHLSLKLHNSIYKIYVYIQGWKFASFITWGPVLIL